MGAEGRHTRAAAPGDRASREQSGEPAAAAGTQWKPQATSEHWAHLLKLNRLAIVRKAWRDLVAAAVRLQRQRWRRRCATTGWLWSSQRTLPSGLSRALLARSPGEQGRGAWLPSRCAPPPVLYRLLLTIGEWRQRDRGRWRCAWPPYLRRRSAATAGPSMGQRLPQALLFYAPENFALVLSLMNGIINGVAVFGMHVALISCAPLAVKAEVVLSNISVHVPAAEWHKWRVRRVISAKEPAAGIVPGGGAASAYGGMAQQRCTSGASRSHPVAVIPADALWHGNMCYSCIPLPCM